jgi:hypothetical protein
MRRATREDAKNSKYLLRITELICHQYRIAETITWRELWEKSSEVTGVNWGVAASAFFGAIDTINDTLSSRRIFSTCVVGENRMPASKFFVIAIQRRRLAADADTFQRMDFWKDEFNWLVGRVRREDTMRGRKDGQVHGRKS